MVTHRLLIVEDDLAFATMMQTWLRKKGFEVDKVSSVGAAAKKVAEDDADFSLVLSDLRLPDGMACNCLRGCARRECNCRLL